MKLTYLGTAAAEGIPGIFCACETCKRALARGGRNIMTRSQALIDDRLLIDFPGDSYIHFLNRGQTLSHIGSVLLTHTHADHLTLENFFPRFENAAYNVTYPKFTFYCSEDARNVILKGLELRHESVEGFWKRFDIQVVKPFTPFLVEGYMVTPFPARHAFDQQAYIYLIEKEGKTIFYGHDTGFFGEEIDEYLLREEKHIDCISLDCTKGNIERGYYTHMSMSEGAAIRDRFLQKGILSNKAICVFNHFSHNCNQIYEELLESAKAYPNFQVSYDGMEVEF